MPLHVPDHLAHEVGRIDEIAKGRAVIASKVRIEAAALIMANLVGRGIPGMTLESLAVRSVEAADALMVALGLVPAPKNTEGG